MSILKTLDYAVVRIHQHPKLWKLLLVMLVPGMIALLMAMDGDTDQPDKTNDLVGVVCHVDASKNGSSLDWCLESWYIGSSSVKFHTFPFPDSKIAKPLLFQNCP